MADYHGLVAVGRSLVDLLNRRFAEVIPTGRRPSAVLAGGRDLDEVNSSPTAVIQYPAVSLFCYRLSVDAETRAGWAAVTQADGVPRLPLRLHFLVMAWDVFAESELEWLGLAVQVLEGQPILTGPLLHPTGSWSPGDAVQVVTDNLGLESVSEAFQALTTKYRLCLPYVARVIRIEAAARARTEAVATVGASHVNGGTAT